MRKRHSSPADWGLTPNLKYEEELGKHASIIDEKAAVYIELCERYGVLLHWPFGAIKTMQWSTPLTDLQRQFPRGRKFSEGGEEWESAGLSWDATRKDYLLYYFLSGSTPPTCVEDHQVERTYFISRPGRNDDNINEWKVIYST